MSLSSLKRLEEGSIKSVDVLIRILRTLGNLDIFYPLVKEEQLSPADYFKMADAINKHKRKRAPKKSSQTNDPEEEPEW